MISTNVFQVASVVYVSLLPSLFATFMTAIMPAGPSELVASTATRLIEESNVGMLYT